MSGKVRTAILCLLVTVLVVSSFYVIQIQGAPSVPFRMEQVAWGTSTTDPIEVEPGDTNAALTTDIRNLSNETLRGVFGTLELQPDGIFTDYITGGYAPTATGVPLQAGDIFNQTGEILPAGSFSLTFRINIDRNAVPGYYPHSLKIEYFVKSQNDTWLQGEPKVLGITILLPNRAPAIDSFSPSATTVTVSVGDSLNFTSRCSDPDNDTIAYEWKLDGNLVSTSSAYYYVSSDEDVGVHTLVLTVTDSRLTASQTWTVTVAAVPVSTVFTSGNYITAGFDNTLNIRVQNNIWKGTVQLGLTVPSPLILRGTQTWTFSSIETLGNVSINPTVFAPVSAIGSTFTGGLSISYGDEHGQTYTDTYSLGLIVQGYVNLLVYDVVVSPQPVPSESEVTVTATILNTGNVVASYANASIQPNSVLDLLMESSSYVGDVERNSPVPFTVVARVKGGVQNGTYPVAVNLVFQDDQYRQHSIGVMASVVVATGVKSEPGSDGIGSILSFLRSGGWTVLVVVGVGVALLILYVRQLSRSKSVSAASGG